MRLHRRSPADTAPAASWQFNAVNHTHTRLSPAHKSSPHFPLTVTSSVFCRPHHTRQAAINTNQHRQSGIEPPQKQMPQVVKQQPEAGR